MQADEDADSRHHLRDAEHVARFLVASGAGESGAAGKKRLLRKDADERSAQRLRKAWIKISARPAMLRCVFRLRRGCAGGDSDSETSRKRTILFQIF